MTYWKEREEGREGDIEARGRPEAVLSYIQADADIVVL